MDLGTIAIGVGLIVIAIVTMIPSKETVLTVRIKED